MTGTPEDPGTPLSFLEVKRVEISTELRNKSASSAQALREVH